MKYKKYAKVVTNGIAVCAIYEPHPFRSSVLSESVGFQVDSGIADDEWIWNYYDYCGNLIGTSEEKPEGIEVDKFTIENLNLTWTTHKCAQNLVDYLNMEPFGEEHLNGETI